MCILSLRINLVGKYRKLIVLSYYYYEYFRTTLYQKSIFLSIILPIRRYLS